MSGDDLKPLIKDALREAQAEGLMRPGCCLACDLEPGEHAKHHDMLRGACSIRSQVLTTLATTLAGGGLVWLVMAAWEKFLREALR